MSLKNMGSALNTNIAQVIPPQVGREDLAKAIGYIENAGVPSAVVPEFIGQRLFDTTNSNFYVAFGVSAGNWTPAGVDTLTAAELAYLDGATTANNVADKAVITTTGGAITSAAAGLTTFGVGAKNGATVSVVEQGDGLIHKTIITCTATPVTITDDAGVAQYGGTGKLYDFPEGLLMTMGAVINGDVTLGTTGTITTTWAGGVALGTATATTGATLTGTEADIMPEVDVAAATASVASVDAVSVATALTESGARWLDGSATAKDMYLNLVVDDSATHTSGTGTFTGTVTIVWMIIGDK